jgi:hypothetical protein
MRYYDPLAAQFANRPLDPWQLSKKNFDFDLGFVAWIRKYLDVRKLPHDVVSAKAWINKSKFDGERYELCELQWDTYRDSLQFTESKPMLRALDGGRVLPDNDLGGADQSCVDGTDDAPIEPELPDEFKPIEGESPQELQARRLRILRAFVGKK